MTNGNFSTWPLLTQHNISKHFPKSNKTIMGHTNQQWQGVRSTKTPTKQLQADVILPPITEHSTERQDKDTIITGVYALTNTIYSDQMGRLPYRSRLGNEFLIIFLHVDSNYTFAKPMKNKSEDKMKRAYSAVLTRMQLAKLTIKKHILDNKCSALMKALISKTCPYKLVPPHCHRQNQAEVTIKSFKQHKISAFAGLDPPFPMAHWDKYQRRSDGWMLLIRWNY